MSAAEKHFVQIFERKKRIIDQVNQQSNLFDQFLASKLLIDGINPPPWLWSPLLHSLNPDPKEFNTEVPGFEVPFSQLKSTIPLSSEYCNLYPRPTVNTDNGQRVGGLENEVHALKKNSNRVDVVSVLPDYFVDAGCSSKGAPEMDSHAISPHDWKEARMSDPALCGELDISVSNCQYSDGLQGEVHNMHQNGDLRCGLSNVLDHSVNDIGCASEFVPEMDSCTISPQIEGGKSESYNDPSLSLARLQRSRSRQRALELRSSSKKASKSCSQDENNTGLSAGRCMGSVTSLAQSVSVEVLMLAKTLGTNVDSNSLEEMKLCVTGAKTNDSSRNCGRITRSRSTSQKLNSPNVVGSSLVAKEDAALPNTVNKSLESLDLYCTNESGLKTSELQSSTKAAKGCSEDEKNVDVSAGRLTGSVISPIQSHHVDVPKLVQALDTNIDFESMEEGKSNDFSSKTRCDSIYSGRVTRSRSSSKKLNLSNVISSPLVIEEDGTQSNNMCRSLERIISDFTNDSFHRQKMVNNDQTCRLIGSIRSSQQFHSNSELLKLDSSLDSGKGVDCDNSLQLLDNFVHVEELDQAPYTFQDRCGEIDQSGDCLDSELEGNDHGRLTAPRSSEKSPYVDSLLPMISPNILRDYRPLLEKSIGKSGQSPQALSLQKSQLPQMSALYPSSITYGDLHATNSRENSKRRRDAGEDRIHSLSPNHIDRISKSTRSETCNQRECRSGSTASNMPQDSNNKEIPPLVSSSGQKDSKLCSENAMNWADKETVAVEYDGDNTGVETACTTLEHGISNLSSELAGLKYSACEKSLEKSLNWSSEMDPLKLLITDKNALIGANDICNDVLDKSDAVVEENNVILDSLFKVMQQNKKLFVREGSSGKWVEEKECISEGKDSAANSAFTLMFKDLRASIGFDATRNCTTDENADPLKLVNYGLGSAENLTNGERTKHETPHLDGSAKFSYSSPGIPRDQCLIRANDTLPELEGFLIEPSDAQPVIAGEIGFEKLDLLSNGTEYTTFLEQLQKPACQNSPLPCSSRTFRIPGLYQSVPNGLLEGIDLGSSLPISDDSRRARSDCLPNYKGQSTWDAKKPYISPVQTLWDRLTSNFDGSGIRASLNPELPCISEEVENADEIAEDFQNNFHSEVMTNVVRQPLANITNNEHHPSLVSQDNANALRHSLASADTESSVADNPNVFKLELENHGNQNNSGRKRTKVKENQSISFGANGVKRDTKSLRNRSSKPKVSGMPSLRKGGPTYSGKKSTRNNIVSHMTSFIPLVQTKQADAASKGKRDIKVKSLQAAEAAKRLAEKKDNERRMKKEALKLQRERSEQETLKHLELQKKKEEEQKRKEAEMAARKRQREEEERKEKERKRKRLDEPRRQLPEHAGKLSAKVQNKQIKVRTMDERVQENKEHKDAREVHETLEKDIGANKLKKTFEGETIVQLNDDTKADTTLKDSEAIRDCGKIIKVAGNSVRATDDNLVPEIHIEESYDISPYKGSDDEDDDEGGNPNSKSIPSWASKHRLLLVVASQETVDPETVFPPQSFCNIAEVLLPRKLQLK